MTPSPVWTRHAPTYWFLASLLLAVVAVTYRLGVPPIIVWDEARLANNALEMAQNGLSLVTTYDGAPDHWNTKPPLLIWAMALSIRLFGANEWSVRLPSAACAVMLCGLVHVFCAQRLARPALGFLAVALLLSSGTFLGWHGARSGNYDVPLALFTTAYLYAAFQCLARPGRPSTGWLVLCAVAFTFAFLTKTVQAAIFLPGLAAYVVARRQLVALLRMPATYACGVGVAAVCVGYYFARETMDPGYLSSALAYDVVGRYASVIERHVGPWSFYLRQWLVGLGLAGCLLLAVFGRGDRKSLGLFLLIVALSYVAIISSAATKLWWYTIPVLPLSVTAIAAAAAELLDRPACRRLLPQRWLPLALTVAMSITGLLVAQRAVAEARRLEAGLRRSDNDQYSEILRSEALRALPVRRFDVAHPGYNSEHETYYVGPTLFYVNQLRHRGYDIRLASPAEVRATGHSPVVLCGREALYAATLGWVGPPLLELQRCGVYTRR